MDVLRRHRGRRRGGQVKGKARGDPQVKKIGGSIELNQGSMTPREGLKFADTG